MRQTVTFERGEFLYIVGPVAPFEPGANEIEEFAFATELQKFAPNDALGWLHGRYVEADRANRNGMIWGAGELAIKSISPRLMPVTVMHDMRSAVGMIADTRLVAAAGSERDRIDTTLGIWRHRFPDVWEEAAENYRQGSLMQSMECQPAYYDCAADGCGRRFPKLPGGAEAANWCEHLMAERVEVAGAALTKAARRLGNVTFTGTGLIFGTRGARGAYDEARLDTLQDEVAALHDQSKHKSKHKRRGVMDIDDTRYQALISAESERDQLRTKVTDLTETAAKVPDLERDLEAAQIAKQAAEDATAAAAAERDALQEVSRATELASTRLTALGAGFKAKLPDAIQVKLTEQAKTFSDEDWASRLEDLATMAGVAVEDPGDGSAAPENPGGEFTAAQIAAGGATGTADAKTPNRAQQASVVGDLMAKV